MGCASSSPLINNPGGVVESAKKTADDVMHAGEEVIHDMGEKAGHVKDALVEAVQSVGHGLDHMTGKKEEEVKEIKKDANQMMMMNGEHIPLKDSSDNMMDHVEDNMEEFKKDFLKKTQHFNDDTEKMADDFIKETDDLMNDAMETTKSIGDDQMNDMKNGATNVIDKMKNELENMKTTMENGNKSPTHSIDSLKTETPDPEIERILSAGDSSQTPTPKHTHSVLPPIHDNGNEMKNEITEIHNKKLTTLIGKNKTKRMLKQFNSKDDENNIELVEENYNNDGDDGDDGDDDDDNRDDNDNDFNDDEINSNSLFIQLPPPTDWESLADAIVPVMPQETEEDNPTSTTPSTPTTPLVSETIEEEDEESKDENDDSGEEKGDKEEKQMVVAEEKNTEKLSKSGSVDEDNLLLETIEE